MSLMPSCKDVTKHSSDYLEHNLTWWKRPGYWLHFAICVHCRRYVQQLKLTINTIGKMPDATPPEVSNAQVQNIVKEIQKQAKELS